ncbi:MAG: hypothetical protein S4CHLAM7_00930 [Chlamydiae bacterium]|nr:hypothetical protein [Chlamydiota bacterium]
MRISRILDGSTILHFQESPDVIQHLLDLGLDPKIQNKRGDTLLHIYGSRESGPEKIEKVALMCLNRDETILEIKNNDQKTPLQLMLEKRYYVPLLSLLGKCPNLKKYFSGEEKLSLFMSVANGNLIDSPDPYYLSLFEKIDFDFNQTDKEGNTALHKLKNPKFVASLIERGAKVDEKNNLDQTPFGSQLAREVTHYEGTRAVSERLAYELKNGLTSPGNKDIRLKVLRDQKFNSDIYMARELIKHSADPRACTCENNGNALHVLFKKDNQPAYHLAKSLIEIQRLNVNARDDFGSTPLHYSLSIMTYELAMRHGAELIPNNQKEVRMLYRDSKTHALTIRSFTENEFAKASESKFKLTKSAASEESQA